MEIKLLRDVLISIGDVDRYYENSVPVNLWRALNRKRNTSLFELVEEPFIMGGGRPRPADIRIEERGNVKWVFVNQRPRGVSTFDKPGVPPGKDWSYYRIPAGTALPFGLAIVRDEHNPRFDATHYTIAPAFDMPLARFKSLLNELAANAVREAI